jgi:beta-lactamase regulating signal transducer with metallopeptidase domain
MMVTAELILRTTAVFAIANALAFALRKASASIRHSIWSLAFFAALLLPVLSWTLPTLDLPLLPARPAQSYLAVAIDDVPPFYAPSATVPLETPPPPVEKPRWTWENAIGILWLLGSLAALGRILGGIVSVRKSIQKSYRSENTEWQDSVADLCHELRISRRVDLRVGTPETPPLVFGILRPIILLPQTAANWTAERIRLVLAHELTHIQRGDGLVQILIQAACIVHWFNPVVWYAARRLRAERERACDDRVLALGANPSDYAEHLLQIARTMNAGLSLHVLAMAHPSQLRLRLESILDSNIRRRKTSWVETVLLLVFIGGFATFAALVQITEAVPLPLPAVVQAPVRPQPAQATTDGKGSLSGVVKTLEGEPAVGIRVAAVAVPEEKQPVNQSTTMMSFGITDSEGRYRLENIPPGKYYILAGRIDFPTYYPGAVDRGGARAVDVVAGDELRAIDFQIKQPNGVTLRGRLAGALNAAPVRVELWGRAVGIPVYTDSKADGTFEFSGVGLGRAYVHAPGYAAMGLTLGEDVTIELPRELSPPGVTVIGKIQNYVPPVTGTGRVTMTPQMGTGSGIAGGFAGGSVTRGGVVFSSSSSGLLLGAAGPSVPTSVNADGSFQFAGVLPGTYFFRVVSANGITLNTPLEVRDKDISGVELVVPFEVTLNGRVFGLDSRLAVSVPIQATPRISAPNTSRMALTNLDGTFSLRLTEGEYSIAPAVLPSGVTLKSVFFDGTNVTRGPLKIERGMTVSDLIMNLDSMPFESLPGVRVSGRAPAGLAGARLDALQIGKMMTYTTEIRSDGSFELSKIPPGRYQLIPRGAWSPQAGTPIEVGDKDLIDVQLLPLADIDFQAGQLDVPVRMTARDASGRALPGLPMNIQIRFDQSTANRTSWSSLSIGQSSLINARLQQGEHRVSISNLPAGYSVESLRAGSRDLLTSPLIVDPKSPVQTIEVVLKYLRF